MADNNSPDPPLSGSPGDSQATPVTSPDTHLSGSPGIPQTVAHSVAVQPSQSSTRQSRTRIRKASQSDKEEHDPPPKKDSRPPRGKSVPCRSSQTVSPSRANKSRVGF